MYSVSSVMAVCSSVYMLRTVTKPSALHHWLFWAVVQFTDRSILAPSEEGTVSGDEHI